MFILGLNAYHGDSSACLVRDGALLAAAEEGGKDAHRPVLERRQSHRLRDIVLGSGAVAIEGAPQTAHRRGRMARTASCGRIELPVDGAIGIQAVDLNGLPDDPADRLIVAMALHHRAALVTADEKLLAWPHPLIRHDARA